MKFWRWIRRVVFGKYVEPSQNERLLSVVGRSQVLRVTRQERSL